MGDSAPDPNKLFKEFDKAVLKITTGLVGGGGGGGGQPAPEAPSLEDANAVAQQRIQEEAKRKRASQTLFTGGQGVLDRPTTASSVLLGN